MSETQPMFSRGMHHGSRFLFQPFILVCQTVHGTCSYLSDPNCIKLCISRVFLTTKILKTKHMDVSENSGTSKSSNLIGFSIINHPFWGTPIFENKNTSFHARFPKIFTRSGSGISSSLGCLFWSLRDGVFSGALGRSIQQQPLEGRSRQLNNIKYFEIWGRSLKKNEDFAIQQSKSWSSNDENSDQQSFGSYLVGGFNPFEQY